MVAAEKLPPPMLLNMLVAKPLLEDALPVVLVVLVLLVLLNVLPPKVIPPPNVDLPVPPEFAAAEVRSPQSAQSVPR